MTVELVVISGKGGTGKTSVAGSLAVLAGEVVVADCDVDASDLHLILRPEVVVSHEFFSGHEAVVDQRKCVRCGLCADLCTFDAFLRVKDEAGRVCLQVRPLACEGCGVCMRYCGVGAIDFPEKHRGHWYESDTRCGPMVHAKLSVGSGNSGKLVTAVRRRASEIARGRGLPWVITDGPPGIGCPVIASLTGATHVLAVTEPTVSGRHDLERLLRLTRHFSIPTFVCVNKYDIHESAARDLAQFCDEEGVRFAGFIPWDPAVTEAQVARRTVVETDNPAGRAIREIWKTIRAWIEHESKEKNHDESDG